MSEDAVSAKLEFIQRLPLYEKEKPFHIFYELPKTAADQRRSNLEFEKVETQITDIRNLVVEHDVASHMRDDGESSNSSEIGVGSKPSLDEAFTLDSCGFAFRKHKTKVSKDIFRDKDSVREHYLPEMEALIQQEFAHEGVTGIYFFDWRIRSSEKLEGTEMINLNDMTSVLRPSEQVHVDQSPSAALHRIEIHVPDERVAELTKGRFRVLNLWRPLNDGPVEDYPLVMCDGSTVVEEDLFECDHIRRKFFGGSYYLAYRNTQKWYYLGRQRNDEVTMMKMFDSKTTGVQAQCCPHGSFKHPRCPEDVEPRKSVEVRALVFTADTSD